MKISDPPSVEKIPWARPAIDGAELAAVTETMQSGWLTSGPRTEQFEREMATLARRRHGVAVSNGTAALDLALRAAGVSRGDRVIVPAFSYIVTAAAVAIQGAIPVFADVDPRNLGLDPAAAADRIGPATAAIIATDHGGNPCDYAALTALASRHNLPLILDGAQSLGASFDGQPCLGYGLISTVSFHAAKTLTTIEGGMVFTDDDAIARRLRILRSQGEDPGRKYHHIELGHNFRITELQAAIGLAQLKKLDALLLDRQKLARSYRRDFAAMGLPMPSTIPGGHNGQFLMSVLVPQRDAMMARLKECGIETRACYPLPLHEQPIFHQYRTDACPVAEHAAARILNPPMFFGLSPEQQGRVVREFRNALSELAPLEMRKAV